MPEAKLASESFDLPLSIEHEIASGGYNSIFLRNAGTVVNLQKFGSGYDNVVSAAGGAGPSVTLNKYPTGGNTATTFHAASGQGVTITNTPTTVGGLLKGDLKKLSTTEKVAVFGGVGLALLVAVVLYGTR